MRLAHLQPAAIGLEPPLQHEGGLLLLIRDETDDVFAEAGRQAVRLDVGHEAVLVLPVYQVFDG
jgi:hypothetical protein